MEAPIFTQNNLLFTVHSPLGKDKLLFKHLHGEEQLSGLFHFQLELLSESRGINFQEILGQSLTVQIQFAPDHTRYLNGIVTRFAQADTDSRFTTYYADIRPWLWQLTLTQNCRIFQNLSVPDIIKKVFMDLGFHDYRFSLVRPNYYKPRVYCVQYQETAFNFVSRLMEDVGIFYFFEHHDDQHVLVLIDDMSGHPDCPEMSTARFWPSRNDTHPEDVVTHCQWQQQLTTGRYAIDDFNFEIPNADLQSSIDALPEQHSTNLRVYEYNAGFSQLTEGQDKVTRRIESQVTEHKLLEGQSYCLSFVSGHCFTLKEHRRDDFNIKYVLRWISHSLSLIDYQNDFIAFPADLRFRTPRITPRPQIVSTQTAIVTGPAGDEIYTDQYGRIKVQFHWDQEGQYDENSSCWIRVNQGWAGKNWGHLAIPRIGQEVIVSFLNGNPNTPIVTGAVYNASQTVPYPLPAEQTKSTLKSNSSKGGQGFNEVRFEDGKGKEQIFIHGQGRMDVRVRGSLYETNYGNREVRVGWEKDGEQGGSQNVLVKEDQNISVEGGRYESIKKTFNQTIEEDIIHDWQKNVATMVGEKSELNAKEIVIEASQKIVLKVGNNNFIVITPGGIFIQGKPIISLNSSGSPPLPEIENKMIEAPLEAAAADTGKTGERSNISSSRSGNRHRQSRTVEAQHAPTTPTGQAKDIKPDKSSSSPPPEEHAKKITQTDDSPLSQKKKEAIVEKLKESGKADDIVKGIEDGDIEMYEMNETVRKKHSLDEDTLAFRKGKKIYINPSEEDAVAATATAHEGTHVLDKSSNQTKADTLRREMKAFEKEAGVWQVLKEKNPKLKNAEADGILKLKKAGKLEEAVRKAYNIPDDVKLEAK